MPKNIYTDLAIEASYLSDMKPGGGAIGGVRVTNKSFDRASLCEVTVLNEEGEKNIGKPRGRYVTIEVPDIRRDIASVYESTKRLMIGELEKLIGKNGGKTILTVGLGNRFITPDALGPKTVDRLFVTRHLKELLPNDMKDNISPLCAISPGVLGITGIESSEIIKGIADKVKPDVIIVIDALVSRSIKRLGTTFQISDTGIAPGSGIGNKREPLTKETLNSQVIAIGVPTVIAASTLANDAIDMMVGTIKSSSDKNKSIEKSLALFEGENREALIDELVSYEGSSMIVAPKEIDSLVDEVSAIIADSINELSAGETAKILGGIL